MGRVWRRKTEPTRDQEVKRRPTEGVAASAREEVGEQRRSERFAAPSMAGDQRRREKETDRSRRSPSYVEILTGRESPRMEMEVHREDREEAERPWQKVQHKKRRRTPPPGENSGHMLDKPSQRRSRHSPPRKRTSSGGVVEVCGQCRQPGHLKNECRRVEVCRRCERPGHREKRCPMPPPELGTCQPRGEKQRVEKSCKPREPEVKADKEVPWAEGHTGERRGEPQTSEPEVEENHYVSLSKDSIMLAENPTARNVSKEHMAKSGEAPHIFSQKSLQEGSRSITPKEPHIKPVNGDNERNDVKHLNNASSSNEEVNDVNENLPHSIAIYSKPETTTKRDNEVEGDSDEIYLDPDFEKQIELEFQ
ncbi:hypothetical protein J5N97_016492 [Dioscorea zingiberensis]|uniref:CCHC-type domain-containing protein n=1 Tax=Dioscorea zingiberensis TaxID=325984 RepID=A0A9D5CJZ2_9LILI|nr:hypothetical protein J5N97_016492 [Dioscorea zingiberensis]